MLTKLNKDLMQADIFVHPDFMSRACGIEADKACNPAYVAYIRALKSRATVAQFGFLAYHTVNGSSDSDTGLDFMNMFRANGRFSMPTQYGKGEPYDALAGFKFRDFLELTSPSELVFHGSYAQACVYDLIRFARTCFDGDIVLGTVLSRYFGDQEGVPHERFLDMHPKMAGLLDPQETKVFSVHKITSMLNTPAGH